MQVRSLHSWQVSPAEAKEIQRQLAGQVSRESALGEVKRIAGVDVSATNWMGFAKAAVVVLRYPELSVEDKVVAELPLTFPYVPGLLSFREAPSIIKAFEQVPVAPDFVMVDGQGIAHPRRIGIASHIGLLLDIPTVGVAKSILVGHHAELPAEPGGWVDLIDHDEVIGAVVRTKRNVKPVYVSIGHKIDLPTAVRWVLDCCRGYRLPEPTRLAHLAAAGKLPAPRR